MFLSRPHGTMDAILWRRIVKSLGIFSGGLEDNPDVDILAPFGTLLFDVPLAEDDIDESLEHPTPLVFESLVRSQSFASSALDRD
jgi:hypothetical protein